MRCSSCGNEVAAGAAFCTVCGQPSVAAAAPIRPAFCPNCGAAVPVGASHCGACGAVVLIGPDAQATQVTPATSVPPVPPVAPVAPGPPEGRGTPAIVWVLAGLAVVLFLVLVGVVAVMVTRDDSDETSTSTLTTLAPTTQTTLAPTTTTTLDPVTQARQARPQLYEVTVRLDNILTQSSAGRGAVGEVVDGVKNCTIDPYSASLQIDDVVFNRQSVLEQVSAVSVTGDPEAASLVAQLQGALQASIDADRHYSNWMNYLYTDYYYTEPVGCPSGAAPTNADYDAAVADSARATAAKQSFVAMYNPIAESFGLPTWAASDI